MAATEFDPYLQWLRVPPGTRPPDHYALLGLKRFEGGAEEIEQGAHKQLARLDRYSLHPDAARRALCQTLMNQVAQARGTLVNPQRRQAYDERLRSAHEGTPQHTPVRVPAAKQTSSPPPDRREIGATPQRRPNWLVAVGVAAALWGLSAVIFLVIRKQGIPAPVARDDTQPKAGSTMIPSAPASATAARGPASATAPVPEVTVTRPTPATTIANGLSIKLTAAPAIPPVPEWDARTLLRAATARNKAPPGTAVASGLYRIADAQLELGDTEGAAETVKILTSMSLTSFSARQRAWMVGMASRAQLPTETAGLYQALPRQNTDLRIDPIAIAYAAAVTEDKAQFDEARKLMPTAPGMTPTGQTENITAMLPFSIMAARALSRGDRPAAERLLSDYLSLAGENSPARFSLSLANEEYLRGVDFQRFLPIPVQLAFDDLSRGNFHDAAVRLESFDSKIYGRGTIKLALAALVRLQRGQDTLLLARELQTLKRDATDPPWALVAASCLAKGGDLARALDALRSAPLPSNQYRQVIEIAEALAAAGHVTAGRDLLRQYISLIGDNARPGNNLAMVAAIAHSLITLGDAVSARDALRFSTSPVPDAHIAALWARLGDSQQAYARSPKSNVTQAAQSALALINAGDSATARKNLNEQLAAATTFGTAYQDALQVLLKAGGFDDALMYCDKLPAGSAQDTFHRNMTRALVEAGELERADKLLAEYPSRSMANTGVKPAYLNGFYDAGFGLSTTALPKDPYISPNSLISGTMLAWVNEASTGAYEPSLFHDDASFNDASSAALGVAGVINLPLVHYDTVTPRVLGAGIGAQPLSKFTLGARSLSITVMVDRNVTVTLRDGKVALAYAAGRPPGFVEGTPVPLLLNRARWYPCWENTSPSQSLPAYIAAVKSGWTLRSAEFVDASAVGSIPTTGGRETNGLFSVTVENPNSAPQWVRINLVNTIRAKYVSPR